LDTASDTPQFVKRLTGRGQLTLEAAAWTDGNVTLRLEDEKRPDFWEEIDVNLGDLLKWYRELRVASETGRGPIIQASKAGDVLFFKILGDEADNPERL